MAVDCCWDDFTCVSVNFLDVDAKSDIMDCNAERSVSYVQDEDGRVADSAARKNCASAASMAS